MRSATSCERRGSGSSEGGVSRTDGGSRHPTREAPGARGGAGARERETYLRVARLGAVKHEEGAPVAIHLNGGVGVRRRNQLTGHVRDRGFQGARFPRQHCVIVFFAIRVPRGNLCGSEKFTCAQHYSWDSHKHFLGDCQTTRTANSIQILLGSVVAFRARKKCGSKQSVREEVGTWEDPG